MKCIICEQDTKGSKEHIIPYAMGNTELVINNVCKPCNDKMGEKIDSYFCNNIFVKMLRQSLDLKGHSKKDVNIFLSDAISEGGYKYSFKNDNPIVVPKKNLENGILRIESESIEQSKDIAKKYLKRKNISSEEIEIMVSTAKICEESEIPVFILEEDIDLNKLKLEGLK